MSQLLRTLTLLFSLSIAAGAGAATLQQGKDYDLVSPPQPTESKGKVEVIEFFSYACPHCAHFEPVLAAWVKKQAKDVVFRRVPVIFRPQWEAPARLYYTLESMGDADNLHGAAFEAIHAQGVNLFSDAAVADWVKTKGVDSKRFADNYSSFSVLSKVQRAKQMTGAYGIQGVPMMVVAGKYRTPDNYPGGSEDMLKLVDAIIAKARTEQK
jgi:thiol:disulfide interchange protein DsbA